MSNNLVAHQLPSALRWPADAALALEVEASARTWLEKAVIGLNLCPFARTPARLGLIGYRVTGASSPDQLLEELEHQALSLASKTPGELETLLLIHPLVMGDFLDFHFFLDEANALLRRIELSGVLQIASFHPHYQFAGTDADDVTNLSNRSPHPILHLLREASVETALKSVSDPDALAQRNLVTLRTLGYAGWNRMFEAT